MFLSERVTHRPQNPAKRQAWRRKWAAGLSNSSRSRTARTSSSLTVPFSFRQPPPNLTTPSPWRTNAETSSTCTNPPSSLDSCRHGPPKARPRATERDSTRSTHNTTRQAERVKGLTFFVSRAVTSPASAAPPTASSRPRTTVPSRSPSQRSTRTADSPARPRPTLSAASSAPWASLTTASTASLSVMATSRTSGPLPDKRLVL
jgi:hypothetical protein